MLKKNLGNFYNHLLTKVFLSWVVLIRSSNTGIPNTGITVYRHKPDRY